MNRQIHYYNCSDTVNVTRLSKTLPSYLNYLTPVYAEPVVLCIGTDRVTGDSLGPLVGHKLARGRLSGLPIYGTLQQPVHALNIREQFHHIKKRHPHAPIIAVDASFGKRSHVGCATISQTALSPGIGVEKQLGSIGDISITGIVCANSPYAQLALQTTRLDLVMKLADFICDGIELAMLAQPSDAVYAQSGG